MPFKSQAQVRKFYALKREGKMDQATIDQWMDETKAKHKSKKDKKHPVNALPERVKKAFAQTITGGKADKNSPSDFDQEELKKGIDVEMEHTKNQDLAKEIAMDHLKEHPNYYTKLIQMEDKMKKEARCWDGYEPVPGKKPYSEDSCKKKKKMGLDKKASENKPLYQPKPSTRAGKKYMVYVKGPNGNPKLIHFGATGYKHNYSEGAKKNFRARHGCDGAQKDTAKWWACNYLWNKKQDIGTSTYEKAASSATYPKGGKMHNRMVRLYRSKYPKKTLGLSDNDVLDHVFYYSGDLKKTLRSMKDDYSLPRSVRESQRKVREDSYQKAKSSYEKALSKTAAISFFAGFIKNAGGPGSGVGYPNTMPIQFLEKSPLVTIGQRKAFMDSRSPIEKGIKVSHKEIKYKGQDNMVPQKLVRIMLNADEVLQKPVDLIRDSEGDYHILDGHHRALAAILMKRDLVANVYTMDSGRN